MLIVSHETFHSFVCTSSIAIIRYRDTVGRVGTATGYGLDSTGIESRWGRDFSVLVQTGPGVHPAYCTMGTGSFPGVKSGRGVTLTSHPLPVPWS
jgi:hypothetical protein